MPDLSGNLPLHVFYGSVLSETLRIARASLFYEDFLVKTRELYVRMMAQGASKTKLMNVVSKVVRKHGDAFLSFNKTCYEIISDLTFQ